MWLRPLPYTEETADMEDLPLAGLTVFHSCAIIEMQFQFLKGGAEVENAHHKMVQGVLGPIPVEALGETLIHEHVVTCCDWSMRMALGKLYFEDTVIMQQAVAALKRARQQGITTIVDGTPINLGRDIRMIQEAARQSGVNVIASSGFYHQEEAVAGFKSEDELTSLVYRDCTQGMGDTDALPGILKCAVDAKGFTPYVEKILRVTARVSTKAQLPIFCHTVPEIQPGDRLLDLFADYGVPMNAVVVGHCGDTDDLDYLERLLRRGCYIGLDRFGITGNNPATTLEHRTRNLVELCRRGWGKQLLVSHDYAPYTGFWPDWDTVRQPEYFDGQPDYTYFYTEAVPRLQKLGLDNGSILALTKENPGRFFMKAYGK